MNSEENLLSVNWIDDYQIPKHSQWLQSSLKELDRKLKEMLMLIEGDVDSSAQGAEIYYQKRPELVIIVDEFGKAYKRLAERFDNLIGEVNEKYELICDSPRGSGPTFQGFSFRSDHGEFLKKFEKGQSDDLSQSFDLEVPDALGSDSKENYHLQEQALRCSDSEVDDPTESLRLHQVLYNLDQENKKLMSNYHLADEENVALKTRINELQLQVSTLQEEKMKLADTCLVDEENVALKTRTKDLEGQVSILREEKIKLAEKYLANEENATLKFRVKELEGQVAFLHDKCLGAEENDALKIRIKELEGQVLSLEEEIIKLTDKCLAGAEDITLSTTKVKQLEEELSLLQEENYRLVAETTQHSVHVKELEMDVCALQEENHVLKEEILMGKNEMDRLQREVDLLQVEGANHRDIALDRANELQTVQNNLRQLQQENQMLATEISDITEQSKVVMAVSKFLRGEVSCLVKRNKNLKDEIMAKTASEVAKANEITCLQEEKRSLGILLNDAHIAEIEKVSDLDGKIKDLHGQVIFLTEENKQQKLVLLERAEEKREAIRQLCFSIDLLKEKNQRLEEVLCSAKMRLNTGFRNTTSSSYHWRKLFLGAWNVPRPQSYALAL